MTRTRPMALAPLLIPLIVLMLYALASLSASRGAVLYPAAPAATNAPPAAPAGVVLAAAQQVSESPTPAQNPTYIVQRGDILYRIAEARGVTVSAIAALNDLTDVNTLRVGQVLLLPLVTPSATATGQMVLVVTPLALLTSSPTPPPPSPTPTLTSSPMPTLTPPPPSATASPAPALEVALASGDAQAQPVALGAPELMIPPTLLFDDADTSMMPPAATAMFVYARGNTTINQLTLNDYLIMDDATRQHVREIFAIGQRLGRDPRAFSKVGDSTIENPFFMDRFDTPGGYNLAQYAWLQPIIDWFRGSFSRDSVAVRVGMHTWTMMDPMWADPYQCDSGEGPLECEIRAHNPAYIYFRLGSNDVGVPDLFEENMREGIEFALSSGVIPIIGTKADRHEGSNQNNDILRRLADEYKVPLWNFDVLAGTIPGRGVGSDGTHMTSFYLHDYAQPAAYRTGHGVHSLSGLIVLDAIWRVIYGGG